MTEPFPSEACRARVAEALHVLGIRNLLLGIHDPSFPSLGDEDTGRGTPYSEGGRRFLHFVRKLGFTGIQLGPQGLTSESNPSPYDGTIFSRNILNISLKHLAYDPAWCGLLSPATLATIVAARPEGSEQRVPYDYVYRAQRRALREAYRTFRRRRATEDPNDPVHSLSKRLEQFERVHWEWLERDALYDVLCREHGAGHWTEWTSKGVPHLDQRLFAPAPGEEAVCQARRKELLERYREEIEFYVFCQFVVHEQHDSLRQFASELGLSLFGDLQIGWSPRDVWSHRSILLRDYRMGAPPSRTNPDGQPWNYAVLDPEQYHGTVNGVPCPGAVLRFVVARLDKMFAEYDGLRIDHPHGWVCPWVYRADDPDPVHAVQHGARLFCSPDLPDHPTLARFAIVTPEQIDRSVPRYADGWVRWLTDEQVERYSVLFDIVVKTARAHGRDPSDLACEVLSTLPYPLRRVLERHGLGRFRVTQKADPVDPRDVYRSENAEPQDWIMVGNHDTVPIWRLAEQWQGSRSLEARVRYLAERLCPEPARRHEFARRLATDPGELCLAYFADVLSSPARNVMVFFTDLLGMKEVYNVPGTVDPANWSLRIEQNYVRTYCTRLASTRALDLPRALAMALRARGTAFAHAHRTLIDALERCARQEHSRASGP